MKMASSVWWLFSPLFGLALGTPHRKVGSSCSDSPSWVSTSGRSCDWVAKDPGTRCFLKSDKVVARFACRETCQPNCRREKKEEEKDLRWLLGTYGRLAVLWAWLFARLASYSWTTPTPTTTTVFDDEKTTTYEQHHPLSGPLLPLELFLFFVLGRTAWIDSSSKILAALSSPDGGAVGGAVGGSGTSHFVYFLTTAARWTADASSAVAFVALGLSRRRRPPAAARWAVALTAASVLVELVAADSTKGLGELDLVLDPFLAVGVLVAVCCGPYDTWAARWFSYWSLAAGLAPTLVDRAVSDFGEARTWHAQNRVRASAEVLACWATGDALLPSTGSGGRRSRAAIAGCVWLATHFALPAASVVDPRRFRLPLGIAVVVLYLAFGDLNEIFPPSVPSYAALFALAADHSFPSATGQSILYNQQPHLTSFVARGLQFLKRTALFLVETAAIVAGLLLTFRRPGRHGRHRFFLDLTSSGLQPNCVLLAVALRRLDDACARSTCTMTTTRGGASNNNNNATFRGGCENQNPPGVHDQFLSDLRQLGSLSPLHQQHHHHYRRQKTTPTSSSGNKKSFLFSERAAASSLSSGSGGGSCASPEAPPPSSHRKVDLFLDNNATNSKGLSSSTVPSSSSLMSAPFDADHDDRDALVGTDREREHREHRERERGNGGVANGGVDLRRVRADATRNHILVLFLGLWILVILRLMPAVFPFSHPTSHAC